MAVCVLRKLTAWRLREVRLCGAHLRSRHHRRRHQRLRHRPRCRRARPRRCCLSSRAIWPARPPRPRPSSSMAGLRYLEHYEFRLVREALIEREVLLERGAAHHLAAALRAAASPRPAALAGAAARPVPLRPSRRPRDPAADAHARSRDATRPGLPLKPEFTRGFEYSDCWVDDARLVVLNAVDAAERGADIRTRTRCVSAPSATTEPGALTAARCRRPARSARSSRAALVNAGGPWVSRCA